MRRSSDGVEPQQLFSGEQFYLGLTVSQVDRQAGDPGGLYSGAYASALLEYDIRDAPSRAVATAERPCARPHERAGRSLASASNPMTRQSSEPWVLANELKRDFNVKLVPFMAEAIDPDDQDAARDPPARSCRETTEYALDQFVMRWRQADRVRRSLCLLRPAAGPDAGHGWRRQQFKPADAVQGLGI